MLLKLYSRLHLHFVPAWLAGVLLILAPAAWGMMHAVGVANAHSEASYTISAVPDFRLRLWPTAEQTRLVIETQTPINYKAFWLKSPTRLVLDVENKTHHENLLEQQDIRTAPYLKKVRSARYNENTIRFVFEPATDIAFEQPRVVQPVAGYGYRLILDIAPKNAPDPMQSLLKKLNLLPSAKRFLVVIDPGHGGEDPGAVSPNKSLEKNVVLQISQRIAKLVNGKEGMQAILTRKDDRFLPLRKRVLIAQKLKADVFVSVHADSVKSRKAMGSSVYILSRRGASSKFARQLAQHANLSDLVGGESSDPQTDQVLPEFVRDGKDRDSRRLANLLIKQIARINRMHKPGVESAGFAVLKSLDIPSVLVETAFISNPTEERKLHNEQFQQKMALAVADGLQEYRDRYTITE